MRESLEKGKGINLNPKDTFIFIVVSVLISIKYVFFWKESVLMAHGAEVLFRLIESEYFSYNHGRIGMLPTQVLPLLFVKLGCSIKTIVVAQSISYLIYEYFFIAIIFFYLKDLKSLVFFIFVNTLSSVYVYYTNEWAIFIAVNYSILLLSYLDKKFINSTIDAVIISVLMYVSISTHPASIILIFTILFQRIDSISFKHKIFYILITIITILSSIVVDEYEGNIMMGFKSNFNHIPSLPELFKRYTAHYSFILLCLGFLYSILYRKLSGFKMFFNVLIVFVFMLYAVLNAFSALYLTSYLYFYFEGSIYTSLCALFIILLWDNVTNRKVLYVIFTITVVRFFHLNFYNNSIHKNVQLIETTLEKYNTQYPEPKVLIINRDKTEIDLYNYYLHYQTYILSNILYNQTKILYATDRVQIFCVDDNILFVNSFMGKEINIEDYSTYILAFYPETFCKNVQLKESDIMLIY